MKKPTLMAVVATLLLLMSIEIVSAGGREWGAIHGTYEMMAMGSCLHSTAGFFQVPDSNPPKYQPIAANSTIYAAATMAQATWVFEKNGEGRLSGTNYATVFPGGTVPAEVRENEIGYPPPAPTRPLAFTYEVTHDGWISVTLETGVVLDGRISKDHKTMTLGNANQVNATDPTKTTAICNTGRVLIRVDR